LLKKLYRRPVSPFRALPEKLLAAAILYRDTNVCACGFENLRKTVYRFIVNVPQTNGLACVDATSHPFDLGLRRVKSAAKPLPEFRPCVVVPPGEADEILLPT